MKNPSLSARTTPVVTKKRCAIYTRKSSDEGLEQEYNSLEAQRDAALAYIASQRHEGWIAMDEGYDDGGFSGGNMHRPALKRLLAEVEAGRIDVIVVYKIDRLSRSLADFVRIVELLDAGGVTFISVTQSFNTTSSMGRLTLNILLSFAQFEREVTGERIRDKIAASKAKGMWMGGVPPLGYDVRDRKLIINEPEADLVRDIFRRYAEHGSPAQLVRELQIEGHTTKSWLTQTGRHHEGRAIDQQYVFTLLRNRLYLGEMTHRGQSYPGQHDAIVPQHLWEVVHQRIETRKQKPRTRHTENPALLSGLLFGPDGQRLLPTFTQKPNGKRYRYYVPYLDKRRHAGATRDPSKARLGALPAAEIEAAVLAQVHQVLQEPGMIMDVLRAGQSHSSQKMDEPHVVVAMRQIGRVWDQLFPVEQHRILKLMIERVRIQEDGLEILWRDNGWHEASPTIEQYAFIAEQQEASLNHHGESF